MGRTPKGESKKKTPISETQSVASDVATVGSEAQSSRMPFSQSSITPSAQEMIDYLDRKLHSKNVSEIRDSALFQHILRETPEPERLKIIYKNSTGQRGLVRLSKKQPKDNTKMRVVFYKIEPTGDGNNVHFNPEAGYRELERDEWKLSKRSLLKKAK